MKRFTPCMMVLMAMALAGAAWAEGFSPSRPSTGSPLAGAAWAGQDKPEPQLRLELDLVDGSRIIGTPHIASVPVQTSYAKMDIPLKQILTIRIDGNHETASIDLRAGDKLKGIISLEPIKLATVFGKVAVGVEHIRDLRVGLAGEGGAKEGLIARYSFDDGTANDTSGYGNHGILHGAKPAPDRSKRTDRAMSFDGRSSWIEVPSSRLYDSLAEISIALWTCPVDDGRGNARGGYSLVTKQPSGSLSQMHGPTTSNHGGLFDLELNVGDGVGQLYFSSQVSPGMCSEGYTSRMEPLLLGQWHHLAITASKAENRLRVYVDGKKVDDVVLSSQIQVGHILSQPNNEPLRIGKRKDADFDRYYFCGSLDDIRIYSRVLKEEEVKQLSDLTE